MSFGGSDSTKTQQQTQTQSGTSTTALDPDLKAALLGNVGATQTLAGSYQPFTGQLTAGFNPTQLGYFGDATNFASGNTGDSQLGSATDIATGLGGFTPTNVTASTISPDQINAYMNPAVQSQTDANTADIMHALGIQRAANAGNATLNGAFGGSGAALENAASNDAADRTLATTNSGIRSQAYSQALSAAQSDAARQDEAALADQSAGIAGAGIRSNAASLLSTLSAQQISQALQKLSVQQSVGDQEQAQTQAEDTANLGEFQQNLTNKMQLQQLIAQALGLVPSTGTTTTNGTASGSGTSDTSSTNWSIAPSFNPATGTISFGK